MELRGQKYNITLGELEGFLRMLTETMTPELRYKVREIPILIEYNGDIAEFVITKAVSGREGVVLTMDLIF